MEVQIIEDKFILPKCYMTTATTVIEKGTFMLIPTPS